MKSITRSIIGKRRCWTELASARPLRSLAPLTDAEYLLVFQRPLRRWWVMSDRIEIYPLKNHLTHHREYYSVYRDGFFLIAYFEDRPLNHLRSITVDIRK